MSDTTSSAAGHEHGHAAGHDEHHGGSLRTFGLVFAGLLALTVCSFLSAQIFHSTPVVSWTIMMAISCAKAMLVISFFMHLIWEANWKYVLTIPASFMSLLLVLLLIPDVARRTNKYSEERWRNAAQPTEEHKADTHATAGDEKPKH